MPDVEDLKIRTYEELIWDKVVKMSEAKEEGNDYFFDELLDEIEMLIKLVPEMYKVFEQNKMKFDTLVTQNIDEHKKLIISIEDDITKDLINTQKIAIIKWEYRSDMLEMLLNLLNYFQMIPFASMATAQMMDTAEVEPIEEEEEEEQKPEQPQPVEKPPEPKPQSTTPPVKQTPKPQPKQSPSIAPTQRPPAQIEDYPNIGPGVKIKKPKND